MVFRALYRGMGEFQLVIIPPAAEFASKEMPFAIFQSCHYPVIPTLHPWLKLRVEKYVL